MSTPDPSLPDREFMRRLGVTLASVLALVTVVFVLLIARSLVLLVFFGVLLAVLLDGVAKWIANRTPLSRGIALTLSLLVILAMTVVFWWFVGPQVVDQAGQFEQVIPEGLETAETWLQQYPWGRTLIREAPDAAEMIGGGNGMVEQVTGVFSTVVGIVINFIVVLFVALYGAANPNLYVGNALKLIPYHKRDRGREVLSSLARALRSWFRGQLMAMAFVGVVTTVGLWLLDVPLALTLGLMAALFEFIPYLGPFLAAAPILLVALLEGPETALYVVIFLIALQQAESYIVTPMAQRYAVSMPPALLIVGQILFGLLFGLIGVVMATPVLVCVIVLVQMLYVEDVLDNEAIVLGSEEDQER